MADAQASEEPKQKKAKKNKKKKDKSEKGSGEAEKNQEEAMKTDENKQEENDDNPTEAGGGDEKKKRKKSKKGKKSKDAKDEEVKSPEGPAVPDKQEDPKTEDETPKQVSEVPEKKEKKKKKKDKNKEKDEKEAANQAEGANPTPTVDDPVDNKQDDTEYVEGKAGSPVQEKKKKKKLKGKGASKKDPETVTKRPTDNDNTKPEVTPTEKQLQLETIDRKPLSDESLQKMLDLAKMFYDVKMNLIENTDKLDDQEDTLDEAEFSVQELSRTRSRAQLVWRVDHFQQRYDEAERGEKPIIYSPSFYTHPYGYKMALSLCPYGDGKAKGECMSIFFCLLQSEMDSLQQWPYTCPIRFSLLDQSQDRRDRKVHLHTDFTPVPTPRNLAFLGRPTSFRNPSLGIPKFASLDTMVESGDKYVRQDTIYIRVEVNLDEIVPL